MSGHLRFCFIGFLAFVGVSPSGGSCNPLESVINIASPGVTRTAPAEDECLLHPGSTPIKGQHWVYRYENHRRCWFEVAEGIITTKKALHHQTRKPGAAGSKEKEIATSGQGSIVDARAELARSAPADTPELVRPISPFSVADAVVVPAEAAVPAAPPAREAAVLTRTNRVPTDQALASQAFNQAPANQAPANQAMPPQVDVERLLAAVPAQSGRAAPSLSLAAASTDENGSGWNATWVGVLLMTLGLISLSNAILCWLRRLKDSGCRRPLGA